MFMKVFNALQLTTLFAAWPFLTQMVLDAKFYAHTVLFWIMTVAYVAGFILMCMSVFSSLDDD
jgi:hypothetical protein